MIKYFYTDEMTQDVVLTALKIHLSPQWHLHLVMAMGLVWSSDLKSYACSSVSTGRVYQTRQVKSEFPDKKRHPSRVGNWVATPLRVKSMLVQKTIQLNSQLNRCLWSWLRPRFRKKKMIHNCNVECMNNVSTWENNWNWTQNNAVKCCSFARNQMAWTTTNK